LVPAAAELETLLRRALGDVGADRLWVNPDCGLKTRRYDEVTAALAHMVAAARTLRAELDGSLPTTVPASTGPSVPAQSGSE
jgi:5-methyltetrahydropteroyltriglutamate--homocysteine methyltransferase